MRWFKALDPSHPTMIAAENAVGAHGAYQIIKVISEAQAQGVATLDVETVAKWAGVKRDRAARLLQHALLVLGEILQESTENLTKILPKSSENLVDFDPSNPRGSIKDRETREIRNKPPSIPPVVTGGGREKFSDSHLEFSRDLWEIVLERYPHYAKAPPRIEKWANEVRLLNDKFDMELIEEVTAWAIKDDFWGQQIRSPANLRKHFMKLLDKSGLYQNGAKVKI